MKKRKAVKDVGGAYRFCGNGNGVHVGDSYLCPGWTSYNKMLQVQEYDVSALLISGENTLSITVTGFVGTPYLLFALADNGYYDTACRVLMNSEYPGWLYEVDMGATTIWECRNSLMPDGTPNPDGMNSYNHYAYGSVLEFVYRRIAGIESSKAGFKGVRVCPDVCDGLNSFKAEYNSVNGKTVSGYERKGDKVEYTVIIPDGVPAEIVIHGEQPIFVVGGTHTFPRTVTKAKAE